MRIVVIPPLFSYIAMASWNGSTRPARFNGWDCGVGERQLSPGDTLALYTDGAIESFNDAGEEFGRSAWSKPCGNIMNFVACFAGG